MTPTSRRQINRLGEMAKEARNMRQKILKVLGPGSSNRAPEKEVLGSGTKKPIFGSPNYALAEFFKRSEANTNFGPGLPMNQLRQLVTAKFPNLPNAVIRKGLLTPLKKPPVVVTPQSNPFNSKPKLGRTPVTLKNYQAPNFGPRKVATRPPPRTAIQTARNWNYKKRVAELTPKPRPIRYNTPTKYSPSIRVFNNKNYTRLTPHGKASNYDFFDFTKGKRIGKRSSYGSVFEHKLSKGRYVIKHVNFSDMNDFHSFKNEVNVGSLPNIGEVGPRIYIYKVVMIPNENKEIIGYGEYIMDNVTNGKKYKIVEDLNDYFMRLYTVFSCPRDSINDPIIPELRNTLLKFYKITKGFHGDLHGGNIFVLTDSKNKIHVRIIDYGSHREFVNKSNHDCITRYIKKEISGAKKNVSNQHRGHVKVLKFSQGQLFTNNAERLSKYNILGRMLNLNFKTKGTTRNNFLKAVEPLKSTVSNYSKYLTNFNSIFNKYPISNLQNMLHDIDLINIPEYKKGYFKSLINERIRVKKRV